MAFSRLISKKPELWVFSLKYEVIFDKWYHFGNQTSSQFIQKMMYNESR